MRALKVADQLMREKFLINISTVKITPAKPCGLRETGGRAGPGCWLCSPSDSSLTLPLPIPSISRLVRLSGRPTPRQVATSITLPCVIFPTTIFCPSGRSMTSGESEIGSGSFETLGELFSLSWLANFKTNTICVISGV